MLKLRIFPDEDHPFDTQPLDKFVMPPRKIREQRPRERRAAVRAQQGSSRESDWLGCRYLEGVSNKVVHNTPFSLGQKCHWEVFQKCIPASIPLRVSPLTTSLPNVIVDPKQRPYTLNAKLQSWVQMMYVHIRFYVLHDHSFSLKRAFYTFSKHPALWATAAHPNPGSMWQVAFLGFVVGSLNLPEFFVWYVAMLLQDLTHSHLHYVSQHRCSIFYFWDSLHLLQGLLISLGLFLSLEIEVLVHRQQFARICQLPLEISSRKSRELTVGNW